MGKDSTGARSPQRKLAPNIVGSEERKPTSLRGIANSAWSETATSCAEASALFYGVRVHLDVTRELADRRKCFVRLQRPEYQGTLDLVHDLDVDGTRIRGVDLDGQRSSTLPV